MTTGSCEPRGVFCSYNHYLPEVSYDDFKEAFDMNDGIGVSGTWVRNCTNKFQAFRMKDGSGTRLFFNTSNTREAIISNLNMVARVLHTDIHPTGTATFRVFFKTNDPLIDVNRSVDEDMYPSAYTTTVRNGYKLQSTANSRYVSIQFNDEFIHEDEVIIERAKGFISNHLKRMEDMGMMM